MKRSINEKKAWNNIYLYTIIYILSLTLFGLLLIKQIIILGSIIMIINILSIPLLIYNGYSLGWEYKRLQIKEENKK